MQAGERREGKDGENAYRRRRAVTGGRANGSRRAPDPRAPAEPCAGGMDVAFHVVDDEILVRIGSVVSQLVGGERPSRRGSKRREDPKIQGRKNDFSARVAIR